MEAFKSCCGAIPRLQPVHDTLPPNPEVAEGVAMIYVGAGEKTLTGSRSGHVYRLSDHRRHFRAHPDDVQSMLMHEDVMRKP